MAVGPARALMRTRQSTGAGAAHQVAGATRVMASRRARAAASRRPCGAQTACGRARSEQRNCEKDEHDAETETCPNDDREQGTPTKMQEHTHTKKQEKEHRDRRRQ